MMRDCKKVFRSLRLMLPAAALLLAGCDKETTLHAGLEEHQANLVMAALLDAGIACSKEAGEEGSPRSAYALWMRSPRTSRRRFQWSTA